MRPPLHRTTALALAFVLADHDADPDQRERALRARDAVRKGREAETARREAEYEAAAAPLRAARAAAKAAQWAKRQPKGVPPGAAS
jgi:hypothetical protein